MRRSHVVDALCSLAMLAAVGAAWWLATKFGWVSRVFLPSPAIAFDSLADGLANGQLLAFTLATLGRMAMGWFLASLLGIVLGAWIGSSPVARAWIEPTLEFLRPLPASALIPLAIAVFGLSAGMVLAVVAIGAMWPVLLATSHGVASVHVRLKEVTAALQLSRMDYLLKIGLPNAMPDILAGMRLAMTVSLIVSVVGEMVASQPGLGQAVLLAARSFQSGELFAGALLLGLIGFTSNVILAVAERRLLRWQRP
ncbi:ABC transporter permease [Roseateles sp.]|uniref:ABC transporter permease n=1 Tax=Roseateles sp. TaxID=1971397 RepID=UPI003263F4C7